MLIRFLAFFLSVAAPSVTGSQPAHAQLSCGVGPLRIGNQTRHTVMGRSYQLETPGLPHNFCPAGGASNVLRVELRAGERRPGERGARERVELRSYPDVPHGGTRWYAGSFRVGEFVPDSAFTNFMQWHSVAGYRNSFSPWLSFGLAAFQPGVMEVYHQGVDSRGRRREPETTRIRLAGGRWHDYVVQAKTDERNGLLRVWVNGELVVDWSGGTLGHFVPHGRQRPNMGFQKFGIYRWGTSSRGQPVRSTATMWFANIEQGNDLSERLERPLPVRP